MPSHEELGLPRRNRTILLVEDNKYNRAILKALLQKNLQGLGGVEWPRGRRATPYACVRAPQ